MIATKSYNVSQALAAIQELTQDELVFFIKILGEKASGKRVSLQPNKPDEHDFFLFGKWPDFEDADTLRAKAWKRRFI